MRGEDRQQDHLFSYVSPERRVPPDHPLRPIRVMADAALERLSPSFAALYSHTGRPSIAPEKLLRALLLQILYSVRSEALLMEQLDYNLLFRWFVGLSTDDPVWDATTFTKNRDRLLAGGIAREFFTAIQDQARAAGLLSDEHFTVDGTLLEAWASQKSFQRKDAPTPPSDDDPGNPTVNFHGEQRSNATHQSTTDPEAGWGSWIIEIAPDEIFKTRVFPDPARGLTDELTLLPGPSVTAILSRTHNKYGMPAHHRTGGGSRFRVSRLEEGTADLGTLAH